MEIPTDVKKAISGWLRNTEKDRLEEATDALTEFVCDEIDHLLARRDSSGSRASEESMDIIQPKQIYLPVKTNAIKSIPYTWRSFKKNLGRPPKRKGFRGVQRQDMKKKKQNK
jgi:hypothetical protein